MSKKLIYNFYKKNPPENLTNFAMSDTRNTGNHIRCNTHLLNKKQISNGPRVLLPDYSTMKATQIGIMNMPLLPAKERIDRAFHTITKPLLSISVMCDERGKEGFTKKEVYVTLQR